MLKLSAKYSRKTKPYTKRIWLRLVVEAIITLEQYMNSATLMPAKYEESLTTVVHWPKSAGMILRNVWGRMMSRIDWKNPKPCDCAASNWLLGTELRPPRTIRP